MKIYLNTFFIILISANSFSQSISKERIQKIKSCTVRITIDSSNSIGTGFFFDKRGYLITCWHVIEPSITRDNMGRILRMRKIFIVYPDGKREQLGIADICLQKLNNVSVTNDFCILVPLNQDKITYPFLKLGNFENVDEGQEVYTCGYPLAIDQQFISKGIVSTKYTDSVVTRNLNTYTTYKRQQALLDLTLNPGNSGGAIMKLGETIEDDEVIGIADFIINSIGGKADEVIKGFSERSGIIELGGVDPNAAFAGFAQLFKSASNGISGCISINHLVNALK